MGDSNKSGSRVLTTLAVMSWIATGCDSLSDDELWERTTWSGKPNLPAQAAQGQPVLYVRFNLPQLRAAETKRIEFPLPDGTSIIIVKTSGEYVGSRGFIWHGKVEGDEWSIATLSIRDDVLVGDVVMSDSRMYRIDQVDVGKQVIFQLEPSKFPSEAEPVEATEPEGEPAPEPEAESEGVTIGSIGAGAIAPAWAQPQSCDEDKIEVLVVYTEAACAASFTGFSSNYCSALARTSIEDKIQQAMGETNTIFASSDTTPRMTVIHVASAGSYTESTDLAKELTRLKYVDGVEKSKTNELFAYLDDIHDLRNEYGADVVSLITKPSGRFTDGSACGRAALMRVEAPWFEKEAFTVVPQDCMVGNFSFGHELGHLMGANHEGVDESVLDRIPGNRGFAKPDPSQVNVHPWRTVMAENNSSCTAAKPLVGCKRLPVFSNPTLDYFGDKMGTAKANNSQVVESTAETVVRFRSSLACDNK